MSAPTAGSGFPDTDLRAHPPRSARVMLGGLVLLARTIDKTRAKLNGTLGVYKVGPGLSMYLLEWLGITEDAFTEAVRTARGDDDVVAWVHAHSDPSTYASINERLSTRGIRDAAHFEQMLPMYPVLRDHPHLRTWFDILDVDDRWNFDPANPDNAAKAPS